jgi:uncharacterized protein
MNNDTPVAGSLAAAQRIELLDIVRGVALLGILIMNMPGFGSSFYAEADGSHLWPGRLDQLAEQLRDALFSGKFNSMFSLLFGIGFTIQFERMQRAEPQRALWLYLRRLAVLGVIGVLHATLLWTGDVLHVYALLGVLLILVLRRLSDRALLGVMVACLLYPVASGVARLLVMTPDVVATQVALAQAFEVSNNAAYGHGSFLDAAAEHAREFAFSYGSPMELWNSAGFYVQMLLTMTLGLIAGRHRWAQRTAELMPQIRRLHVAALVVGIACGVLFTVIFESHRTPGPTPLKLLGSVAYWLSRLSMMIFYVLTVVRLLQWPFWQRAFKPIACAGRLPLTNYLMQTLICTAIFYGWGLGLWGRVGPAAGLALAFGIYFLIQVPWSVWWLRRHDSGPLEKLWSRLTYGSRRPAAARVAA